MMRLLRAFLRLGADEGTDPSVEPALEDASLDLDLDPEPEPAIVEPEPESPAMKAVRERAEAAERRAEEAERRAAQQQSVAQVQQPSGDPETAREEQQLAEYRRSGATAEQISWLEWKIGNDRRLRAMEQRTQQATSTATDMADKASFDRLETSEPKRYKFFAPKVEAAVADMRARGQTPPPRTAIYDFLIGKAVREGTLKVGAAKTAAAPAAAQPKVDRGRMPGARSDVNPKDKSGMTEHQKRIERMKAEFAKGHTL
jgi:hypothetical protein